MDCVACGKPISITAKFCGKCGAPVMRDEPSPADEASAAPQALEPTPHQTEEVTLQNDSIQNQSTEPLDELVLTIDLPVATAEHKSLLEIDLNLPPPEKSTATIQTEAAIHPELPIDSHGTHQPAATSHWQAKWEADQGAIKSLLEKHSHVLDFISLSAQQQSHLQNQPNPLEPLLKEVIQQQGQLQAALNALEVPAHQPHAEVTLKMPEEFKLLLEKQKIELQKFFSQNIAHNSSNIEATNSETIAKIEAMLSANATTTENLEKSLVPITQTVADLRAKLQAVSKKIDDASSQSKKTTASSTGDSSEGSGGFIIFIIGLMCGLTVVLSSLAIYNFLSHEPPPAAKTSHDEPGADHSKAPAKDEHDSAASGHTAASNDKPTADSHSKDKSH